MMLPPQSQRQHGHDAEIDKKTALTCHGKLGGFEDDDKLHSQLVSESKNILSKLT